MDEVDRCPCCGSAALREVAASTYRHADEPEAATPGRAWADRVQRDFVFAEWLPDRAEVMLRELVCGGCGILVFSPRPTQADVDRKYELLVEYGVPLGAASPDTPGERRRARQIRDRLAPHLPRSGARLLDIGGGDGRLMSALREEGAACFLVDYATAPAAGVTKLGDTLEDLDSGAAFDAVIVSHVLEHLAHPTELLVRTRDLAPAIYAEVPVEIWRGTPTRVDPVTHLNHFTESSLRAVLGHAGWGVARSRTALSTYAGSPLEIAWAVATAGGATATEPDATPDREALRRLHPSLAARLVRRVRWARHQTALRNR